MAKRPPKRRKGPRPPRESRSRGQGQGSGGIQQQVIQLQEEMAQAQEALKSEEVTATVGGGVISAVANGHQQVLSIKIDPEVVDPDDVEMLEDMVLAAVNEALDLARELAAEKMSVFTGGLDIPGLT